MAEADMPDLGQVTQFSSLPGMSVRGIYFLYWKGEVVYVGQAKNVRKRLAQHLLEGTKSFDAVSFVPCGKSLNQAERFYIERLLPKYNKCSFTNTVRRLRSEGYTEHTVVMEKKRIRIPRANVRRTVTIFRQHKPEPLSGEIS